MYKLSTYILGAFSTLPLLFGIWSTTRGMFTPIDYTTYDSEIASLTQQIAYYDQALQNFKYGITSSLATVGKAIVDKKFISRELYRKNLNNSIKAQLEMDGWLKNFSLGTTPTNSPNKPIGSLIDEALRNGHLPETDKKYLRYLKERGFGDDRIPYFQQRILAFFHIDPSLPIKLIF